MSNSDDQVVILAVKRYKQRLESCDQEDLKTIMKTLKKLDGLTMTLDVLKETRIGRLVNSLKKHSTCGGYADMIVKKWKTLVPDQSASQQAVNSSSSMPAPGCSSKEQKKKNKGQIEYEKQPVQTGPNGYDPTGNWKMAKQNNGSSKNDVEMMGIATKEHMADGNREYDPTQNWKMASNTRGEQQQDKDGGNKKKKKKSKSHHHGNNSMDYEPSKRNKRKREEYEPTNTGDASQYEPSSSTSNHSSYHPSYQPAVTQRKHKKQKKHHYNLSESDDNEPTYNPYSPTSEKNHNYPPSSGKNHTYSPSITKNRAYSPSNEKVHGYSPSSEKVHGYSPSSGKNHGYSPSSEKVHGYSPSSEKVHGYSPSSEKVHGYSPSSEKVHGYSPSSGKNHGYSPSSRKNHDGYSPSSRKSDSYSPSFGGKKNGAYSPVGGNHDGYSPSSSGNNAGSYQPSDKTSNDAYYRQAYSPSGGSADVGGYRPSSRPAKSPSRSHAGVEKSKSEKKKAKRKNNDDIPNEEVVKRKTSQKKVDRKLESTSKNNNSSNGESSLKKAKMSAPMSFEAMMQMGDRKIAKKKKKLSSAAKLQQRRPEPAQHASKASSSHKTMESIKIDLPEITIPRPSSKIYQPAPTVRSRFVHMPSSSASSAPGNVMTDQKAAELHTQRNIGRTLVYSGVKRTASRLFSLMDICINYLKNNVDRPKRMRRIIGSANIPFDIFKPVLEVCNADQLARIEAYNEELIDDTHQLWKKHVEKSFKGKTPRDEYQSWRELYWELQHERQQKLELLTKTIKTKTQMQKPLEKRTKLAFVGIGEAKAPRNVLRAQLKYGTGQGRRQAVNISQRSGGAGSSGLSASKIKSTASEIRMAVPVGSITADNSNARRFQPKSSRKPAKAPLMMKTLKSMRGRRR